MEKRDGPKWGGGGRKRIKPVKTLYHWLFQVWDGGHQAADCSASCSTLEDTPAPAEKPEKLSPRVHEMAVKGAEVIEFTYTHAGDEAGALTKDPRNLTGINTDNDEDPLDLP